MRTCVHTYIHTYIHTCTHTCVHAYIHTHLLTFIPTHLPTYLHTYILHTYIRTCASAYLRIYVPVGAYTHTHHKGHKGVSNNTQAGTWSQHPRVISAMERRPLRWTTNCIHGPWDCPLPSTFRKVKADSETKVASRYKKPVALRGN